MTIQMNIGHAVQTSSTGVVLRLSGLSAKWEQKDGNSQELF